MPVSRGIGSRASPLMAYQLREHAAQGAAPRRGNTNHPGPLGCQTNVETTSPLQDTMHSDRKML